MSEPAAHASVRLRLSLGVGVAGLLLGAAAAAAPGDLTRVSVGEQGGQAAQAASRTAVSADGRFVAFTSVAQLTGTPTGGKRQLYVRDRQAGRTILASVSAAGAAAAEDVDEGDTFNPFIDISGDGRYAVFASAAANLAPGDANARKDVFRKDLETGEVVIVSRSTAGEQANQDVPGDPSISHDGARVAFVTGTATNLFPGDIDNVSDVVVRDIPAGTTTLVSRSSTGVQANGFTERPSISADGRTVAFEAVLDATNLFPGDGNNANDVIVRDLVAGTTVAASVAIDGQVLGGGKPRLAAGGRYVVFDSGAQLDPGTDTNMATDVYRRDLVGGVTTLVSARDALDAAPAQGGANGDVSADGLRVAFESAATDLTGADANNAVVDVYVRDPSARSTVRASARADGGQGANASGTASVAGNGGLVAFAYDDNAAQPLVQGDTNNVEDVFAKELAPSDTTAPALTVDAPAEGLRTTASQVTVTGTVGADPSGIGGLAVDGERLDPATGTFTRTVQLGAVGQVTPVTVGVTDGAGNRAVVLRTVTRIAAAAAPRARATRITARRAGRTMTVRFRLSASARVRVEVLRVTATRPRLRLVRAAAPVTRTMRAGDRGVRLRLRPAPPGTRYRVRVTVLVPAAVPVSAGGSAR